MEFIIHPSEGVEIPGKGMIRFGASREEVRAFFEEKPDEFFKVPKSFPTDAFNDTGVHVYYQSPGILTGFDFYHPSNPTIDGVSLLSIPFNQVRDFLIRLNGQPLVSGFGSWDAKSLGVSLYECLEEDEWDSEPVESVSVVGINS